MTKIITPPVRAKSGKFTKKVQEPEIAQHEEVPASPEDEVVEEAQTHEAFIKPPAAQNEENEEYIESTSEIDLDQKAESEKNTAKVNFMKGDFMKDYISKKTKPSEAENPGIEGEDSSKQGPSVKPEQPAQPVQPEVGFARDDMAEFATVFMDILDMGISTGLRFWAKDTSTTEYELPVDKKRRLVGQLTNIFFKYQTKFSLEFMFVVTLAICYSVPIQKANKKRKAVKAGITTETDTSRGPGRPSKR